ncbi:hypothetical protein BKI52_30880 [marine bacterium AO1-C]|nr:hypothetical protein BKI52_30880 [marine bacterium AO1-C]
MKNLLILFVLLVFCQNALGQSKPASRKPYKNPIFLKKNPQALSEYLNRNITDDSLKVVNIYTWITHHIKYDLKSFLKNQSVWKGSRRVIQSKRGVCLHYSRLFQELCRRSGIQSVFITGYIRDSRYQANQHLYFDEHAWNAVNIHQRWYLLDATWGSGYIALKRNWLKKTFNKLFRIPYINHASRFKRQPNHRFFLSKPSEFVLTHLPCDPKWQLLDKPVSLKVFGEGITSIKQYLQKAPQAQPITHSPQFGKHLHFSQASQDFHTIKDALIFNPKNHRLAAYAFYSYAQELYQEWQKDLTKSRAKEIAAYYEKSLHHAQLFQKDNRQIYRSNLHRLRRYYSQAVTQNERQFKRNTSQANAFASLAENGITKQKKLDQLIQKLMLTATKAMNDSMKILQDSLLIQQKAQAKRQRIIIKNYFLLNALNDEIAQLITRHRSLAFNNVKLRYLMPLVQNKKRLFARRNALYQQVRKQVNTYAFQNRQLGYWLRKRKLIKIQSALNIYLEGLAQTKSFWAMMNTFYNQQVKALLVEKKLLTSDLDLATLKHHHETSINRFLYNDERNRMRLITNNTQAQIKKLQRVIRKVE